MNIMMADINYDEFTNSIIYPSDYSLDPMYSRCRGEYFPERLSRLHINSTSSMAAELFSPVARRHNRRSRDRYKTQPITFDEITEVDEDNAAAAVAAAAASSGGDDKKKFAGFSQSLDESFVRDGRLKSFGNLSANQPPRLALPETDERTSEYSRSRKVSEDDQSSDDPFGSQPDQLCESKSSGFSAALECARRRRKYSKRNRRRNSDMDEEEVAECPEENEIKPVQTCQPIVQPPATVVR